MRRAFPRQGWDAEIIEDSEQSFAINMRSCFYLDVLTAYGAPELTPVFCRMDGLLYEGLPEAIAWERTQTLGEGGDCCDFRWKLREGLPEGGGR